MKSFIRYFAEHHLLANLLTVIIILLGVSSLMNIKRDLFPSVDMDEMIITTRYPGASPEDVELNVTNKIEDGLKGVDGIDQMTSYSMENISVIDIKLDPDASDKEKIKRDIRNAVDRVSDFPIEVTDAPVIQDITTDVFPVIWVGITGDIPYSKLRLLSKHLEKRLQDIKGVSRIEKTGFLDREIKVEVSQKAVDEYQIPLREIISAIQMRNIRATGGSFESYTSDKNIVALAQFGDPKEAGDVIVRSTFEGPRIVVKDLAIVKDGFEPEKTRMHMNGREVIAFTVYKKEASDIIRVVDAVKELVEKEKEILPEGVEVIYSSDWSRFIRTRLDVLSTNGLIGLALVSLMLFIFLDFRTAFWVAMGIPLTGMGILFLAPYFGLTINALTLMALIVVIGLIVDDAIVIAENIYHRRELGESPHDAAVNGTYGVIRPVTTTIITTILAFSPMFFMSGMMGKFMFAFPLVIVLALIISFAEVILIMPAHISAGRERKAKSNREINKHGWFDVVRARFQRFIIYVLHLRYVVVLTFVVLLVGAFWYANSYMQFVLFSSDVAEEFYIAIELPTGTSLQATSDKVKEIEELVTSLPEDELQSFMTFLGMHAQVSGEFQPGESENWAMIWVTLSPFSERSRTADEIIAALRERTNALTGYPVLRYIVDAGGPPVGRPITLRIAGSDDNLRSPLADSVVAFLSSMEEVTDIDRDDKHGKEQMEIKIDHNRLSQLGLTVADIAQNVRLAYDGEVVTRVRYGDEDVGFRVILEEKVRKRPGYLGKLKIPNRQGRLIPLKDVARFKTGPGPSSFIHYKGDRTITVSADLVDGSSLTPLQATNAIIDHFDLVRDWPGMRFVMGGEAEETQKSMVSLAIAMLMAAVGIYIVLILLFGNLTQPIVVMLAIPFGMIGVVGAFAFHGESLGFLAMLGVIGMMGVVVNDSLILVNYINVHREEEPEKKYLRLIAEGTSARLRPIILTSVTTVAGLLPTAYGIGGFDPFIAPMALALGYGILFATPLTLLLLPCFYVVRHDIGNLAKSLFGKGTTTA
jgi:multidrug efflux pump subunit AcrB